MDSSVTPADLTLADFTPHVDTAFQVAWGDQVVTLTLVLAAALPRAALFPASITCRAEPFQLQFLEPRWSLPQHSHHLTHPVLGPLTIFLVPIGPNKDKTGFRYQAAFT